MTPRHTLVSVIDTTGCQSVPFVEDAVQTYYDYVNGAAGFLVLVIAAGLLAASLVSRAQLRKVPGWLGGVVVIALALGSLPVILTAFGIELGCNDPDTGQPPAGTSDLLPDGDALPALDLEPLGAGVVTAGGLA